MTKLAKVLAPGARARAWGNEGMIRPGKLGWKAERWLTQGACWALAESIRCRTGWPIILMGYAEDRCVCDVACAWPHWSHAVNWTGSTLVDAGGRVTRDQLEMWAVARTWPLDRPLEILSWQCSFVMAEYGPALDLADSFVDTVLVRVKN